jgi:hypothetical protein
MTTPIYGTTEWAAAQSAPWNAHNTALRLHEAVIRGSVVDRDLTAPPGTCADGDCYLVDATATGAWAGHDGELAVAVGTNAANGWLFATVETEGQELWVEDETIKIRYVSSSWVEIASTVSALNDLTDVNAPTPGDGDVLTWDNGADEWVPLPPTGGGGGGSSLTLISSTTTSGSATSVTFSSIPGTYKELIVRVFGRSQGSTDNDTVILRFNSDTGNNYQWARDGAAVSGASTASAFQSGSNSASGAVVGFIAGATSTSDYPGMTETQIPHYTNTTFKKVGWSKCAARGNGTAYEMNLGFDWNNTAAITGIDVKLAGSNAFVNGSIVELIGVSY